MATLGSFELDRPLARGGMGAVWAGTHQAGVPVAIKVLGGDDRASSDAMHAEITALAALHHPAIVVLYDAGVLSEAEAEAVAATPGTAWVAMELASGGSLADHPPASWTEVLRAAEAMLGGLAHAHARGIVHRDLKPANVLRFLATDLRPGLKLADFGLATRVWEQDGRRIGTPRFMAPEQIRGDWADFGPWTDLYALGCVIHELCCGASAFAGDSTSDVARAHLRGERSPFAPWFDVPTGLPGLLDLLLAPEPSRRPDRAADVLAALRALDHVDAPALPVPAGPLAAPETMDLTLLDLSPVPDAPPERPLEPAAVVPSDWRGPSPPRAPLLNNAGMGLSAHRVPPLVGRETERDQLWAELRRVAPGTSRRVVVRGELGSGTSRLARWLLYRAHELGVADVLEVRSGPGLSTEVVRGLLSLGGLDGARLRTRVAGRLPGDPDLAHTVSEALLGGAVPPVLAAAVLRSWAGRRPLILLVDDSTVEDLAAVERFATPAGLLVVACGAPWPGADAEVVLGPLGAEAHRALVTDLLGLSSHVADILEARTSALPGLTMALVRTWVAQGALVPAPHGLELAPGHEQAMPSDLAAAWADRLDALAQDRPALQRLAALGPAFDAVDVTAVDGAEAVRRAHRAGVLVAEPHGWRFASSVAWEVLVAASQAGGTWASDRRWAAARLQARWPQFPERWVDALLDSDGRDAVDAVVDAVDERLQADPVQAAALRRCLDLVSPEQPDLRIRITGLLVRLDTYRGRYDEAEAWIARAAAIDPEHLEVRLIRAQLAAYRRRFRQVLDLTDIARADVSSQEDWIRLLRVRAMSFTELRDIPAALDTWRSLFDAVAASDGQPDSEVLRSYSRALSAAGRHEEARELCTRALELVRGGPDRAHEGRVTSELAYLALHREDWPEVVRLADEAERLMAPFGVASQVYSAFYAATALWTMADYDAVAPRLERIERAAEIFGVPLLGAGAAVLAAALHARQGDWVAVEADVHRARPILTLGEEHGMLAEVAATAAVHAEVADRAELAAKLLALSEAVSG